MKEIIIDGNKFDDLESFYCHIDDILTKDLTWETGHNLDALNDLLRGGFGVYEYHEEVRLIWKDSEKSKVDLGWKATISRLKEYVKTKEEPNKSYFQEQLIDAEQGIGDTLFETIIEIITDHDHIDFHLK